MGFSRQEYWGGFPCPPPGDLPDPGIELKSPALAGGSLPLVTPGKPVLGLVVGIYPKLGDLKEKKRHLSHAVSEVRSPGTAELGGSGLESLRKLQPTVTGSVVVQRLDWGSGGGGVRTSDMVHSGSSWREQAGRR